jgi:membrane protease subunit (stomatin/prohibitin family)
MGTDNVFFLEVLEWLDATGRELVHRIPEAGSGEIKLGAQLTVRESQAAVLFYQGRAFDAFGPGRHTLHTANIPILTKVLSAPWGMKSPLRAEVYFVSLKVFAGLTWGTSDPVAFKDSQLGLIRLRAHGVFNVQVVQPALLINSLVGTQGIFTTAEIEEYLARVVVSRFNDHLGEHLDSVLNLPGRYDELATGLTARLAEDFARYGLALRQLYIMAITPPADVQKAIDDKSRLAVFDDLNRLLQMKAAMAIEKVAEGQGEAGAGAGMGLGLMMPAVFARAFEAGAAAPPAGAAAPGANGGAAAAPCPECGRTVGADARFCPSCGRQLVVYQRCARCGEQMLPDARFCSRCGTPSGARPQGKRCAKCGGEGLPESVYCNRCGERL